MSTIVKKVFSYRYYISLLLITIVMSLTSYLSPHPLMVFMLISFIVNSIIVIFSLLHNILKALRIHKTNHESFSQVIYKLLKAIIILIVHWLYFGWIFVVVLLLGRSSEIYGIFTTLYRYQAHLVLVYLLGYLFIFLVEVIVLIYLFQFIRKYLRYRFEIISILCLISLIVAVIYMQLRFMPNPTFSIPGGVSFLGIFNLFSDYLLTSMPYLLANATITVVVALLLIAILNLKRISR